MGSAEDLAKIEDGENLRLQVQRLGEAIASRSVFLLTGATTGLIYIVGDAARKAGAVHIGVSPASSFREHIDHYQLPADACDALIYTGFGLKGRNVVLVRSCDIAIFVRGGMGSLNELTIAHDEGKVIGCLTGTGGVADHSNYLIQTFAGKSKAQVFSNSNPEQLLDECLAALQKNSFAA
jgi:uncharacterized protein (TIGR00725 family)